jgi:hypothetical protein
MEVLAANAIEDIRSMRSDPRRVDEGRFLEALADFRKRRDTSKH